MCYQLATAKRPLFFSYFISILFENDLRWGWKSVRLWERIASSDISPGNSFSFKFSISLICCCLLSSVSLLSFKALMNSFFNSSESWPRYWQRIIFLSMSLYLIIIELTKDTVTDITSGLGDTPRPGPGRPGVDTVWSVPVWGGRHFCWPEPGCSLAPSLPRPAGLSISPCWNTLSPLHRSLPKIVRVSNAFKGFNVLNASEISVVQLIASISLP